MTVCYSPSFIVTPWACAAPSPRAQQPGIPANATTAATQIQTAVRTALANGKRRLCVDLLMAAIDARARTYDDKAAQAVFHGLVSSVKPIMPVENSCLHVVVNGATTALRVRKWLDSQPDYDNISVSVLGANALQSLTTVSDTDDGDRNDRVSETSAPSSQAGALLVLNPLGTGDSMTDLRALLASAHERNLPVVVQNHPREETVYKLLGYGGVIPYEMWEYEPVFVLAPFALRGSAPDGSVVNQGEPPRFVLMRQFPTAWGLWFFTGGVGPEGNKEGGKLAGYDLCAEFQYKPSDDDLLRAIMNCMSNT